MIVLSSILFLSFFSAVSAEQQLVKRAATGDTQCGATMCISATVNGSDVEYVLSSAGTQSLGWMGMGFGQKMTNTPMVVMWPNPDGTITLSQRSATQHVMPTVDSNPPRIATLSTALSSVSGSTPKLAYTIPANSDTKQFVIYAFGTQAPSSSAVDATFEQHIDMGVLQLDLTKALSAGGSNNTMSTTNGIPLLPYQKMILAHGIICAVGFLLFLPAGALLARYLRTFFPAWFLGHWVVQFGIAGPTIVTGFALGVHSVTKAGAAHLDDTHKKWGVALFVLYLAQCSLGGIIHWLKPKNRTRRPAQNYMHAVLGLFIVGAAFYQVRTGYSIEWRKATGRDDVPKSVRIVWCVWVVLIPVLYFTGLAFLPRQLRQETKALKALEAKNKQWADLNEYED